LGACGELLAFLLAALLDGLDRLLGCILRDGLAALQRFLACFLGLLFDGVSDRADALVFDPC
jgi:hypothetical protein